MLNKYTMVLLSLVLYGCNPSQENEIKETGQEVSYGIVSEDPPGADDWIPVDTGVSDTMSESYPGCSNQVPMWSEPDPLAHPCNFKLVNQYGETVELYDFEGDVIVLDFSTMWCRVCKTVADHVQNLHDTYSPLSIITILTEDTSGNEPTVDKLLDWSTEYGITTAPILAGNSEMTGTQPDQWNVNGIPCFFLIDKSFYVRIMQPGWNEETMIENIEILLAE